MSSRPRLFESSVGTKLLIGATGLFLFLYLIIHIGGNLVVFGGPDIFNRYAAALAGNPLIPLIEAVLLLGLLAHAFKAVTMFFQNRAARPVAYAKKRSAGYTSRKSLASSTMILSGLWLLAFLVLHVRAFRFGPEYERDGVHDLYRLEFENLQNPLMVGFYLLSMLVVGSHLWHGIASSLQSLGVDHPVWTPRIRAFGKAMAILIAGGFMAIVIWVYVNQSGQVAR
jgi:succinate dehydrogenase / fumarate reductase cytochrome b subunit